MTFDMQTLMVVLLVVGSAGYVLRNAWAGIRAANSAKGGCGGCNACGGCPTDRE